MNCLPQGAKEVDDMAVNIIPPAETIPEPSNVEKTEETTIGSMKK